jgi:prolyl-tRNA synthetase
MEKKVAVNEEVLDAAIEELGLNRDNLERVKAAEVGNIFNFGSDKAEQMDITFTDQNDRPQPIFLASYGIGVTRVMGVIAEKFSDEKGLVWPESVAPFRVYLIRIGDDEDVVKITDELYTALTAQGVETLYDDRPTTVARPGEKFVDADLLGLPHRVIVSPKLTAVGQVEYKSRTGGVVENLTTEALFAKLNP